MPAKADKSKVVPPGGKRRRKPRCTNCLYIHKVLKQVFPDKTISNKAIKVVDSIVNDLQCRIVETATSLAKAVKRKTVSDHCVDSAVKMCLPGELAKHAVSAGTKAVTKYTTTGPGGEHKGENGKMVKNSSAYRAGLQFPPSRQTTALRAHGGHDGRVGATAGVYLAAVLEYLVAEVLEVAGDVARDNKKTRISPRHVLLAIRKDGELDELLPATVAQGGVPPHIQTVLLPKKAQK